MAVLSDTLVRRRGVSAAHGGNWRSGEVGFSANGYDMRFTFAMSAAGGGRTAITLEVGPGDLELVLQEIARHSPGAVELMASVSAQARQQKLTELAAEAAALAAAIARVDEAVGAPNPSSIQGTSAASEEASVAQTIQAAQDTLAEMVAILHQLHPARAQQLSE